MERLTKLCNSASKDTSTAKDKYLSIPFVGVMTLRQWVIDFRRFETMQCHHLQGSTDAHWHRVMQQKKGIFICTSVKTPKLADKHFLSFLNWNSSWHDNMASRQMLRGVRRIRFAWCRYSTNRDLSRFLRVNSTRLTNELKLHIALSLQHHLFRVQKFLKINSTNVRAI